ncbi:MAG: divergent polysaccharide deacetylase family protein [Thermodesulfobacteriota bacterium]
MTKKPTRKPYRSSTRRTKRKQKSFKTRSILIVGGFIFLISFVLYGLYSLKNEATQISNGPDNKKFIAKIEETDKSLYEVFFKLGISNKDIIKETNFEENKDGFTWSRKKQSIKLNKPYSKDEITKAFNQLLSLEDTTFNIQSRGGSYLSRVDIKGYNTHEFNFIYKKDVQLSSVKDPAKSPVKTEIKTEEKDKALKTPVNTGKRPKISIIVDDVGINKKAVDELIEISNNLTFAILPNRLFTSYAAENANKNNIEILLHQPMEPKTSSGYTADDAGDGVLLVGQTKEDIVKTLNNNLLSIPNVSGVNNHMGSKFTENEELMHLIMKNIKQKKLLYVDSLTSPDSKGYTIAKEMGVKTYKRDVFLDDKKKGKSYVKKQLKKLVSKAQKNGYAIGICHTYPQTIEALREEFLNISNEVDITPINKLYN